MTNHTEEHVNKAITKLNNNMRLKPTTTTKLVAVKGPGGICKVSLEKAKELCERDGFKIHKEPTIKTSNVETGETSSKEVTAESIRDIRSNKDMDVFVKEYSIDAGFVDGDTLSMKKDKVISILELEE